MAGAPWFLLAAGIVIVILGFLWASVAGDSDRGRPISRRMRDRDIIRELDRAQRVPLPNLVIALGFACVLASVVWRLARWFL